MDFALITKEVLIMKKTLAALAVLGTLAGSAVAGDVTIYGRIDGGFLLQDWEKTNFAGVKTDGDKFTMDSGLGSTNRVGIKGSEKISDDLTVGFVLETKLTGDTGAAFNGGFDRESLIFAQTNYGTIYAGRVGSMWSDGGATNFWAGNYVVAGTGGAGGLVQGTGLMVSESAREANRISYVSPEFGGFKFYAEYSFGKGVDDYDDNKIYNENTSKDERPAAIGLNYLNGPFGVGAVVTYRNEASMVNTAKGVWDHQDQEDEVTVNIGTHYDMGWANFKLAGQYFKGADSIGNVTGLLDLTNPNDPDKAALKFDDLKGYSIATGATVPAWGGTWDIGVYYTDAETDTDSALGKVDFKGYNVGALYAYPLSKRSVIKTGIGYVKVEADAADAAHTSEYEATIAAITLLHYF